MCDSNEYYLHHRNTNCMVCNRYKFYLAQHPPSKFNIRQHKLHYKFSSNPFAENYSAKKRKKIPANEIIQISHLAPYR